MTITFAKIHEVSLRRKILHRYLSGFFH